MSFSRIPTDLQECILDKIAAYKIRLAFAKALMGYLIRNPFHSCEECGHRIHEEVYEIDICADGILGPRPCCYIELCTACKDTLPLECGHRIHKEVYEPKDTNYYIGYYCHDQMCSVCNTRAKVTREWSGLTPTEWFHRYG